MNTADKPKVRKFIVGRIFESHMDAVAYSVHNVLDEDKPYFAIIAADIPEDTPVLPTPVAMHAGVPTRSGDEMRRRIYERMKKPILSEGVSVTVELPAPDVPPDGTGD